MFIRSIFAHKAEIGEDLHREDRKGRLACHTYVEMEATVWTVIAEQLYYYKRIIPLLFSD